MALGVNLGGEEDWVPSVLRGQVAEERGVATPRPWLGNGWGSTLGVLEPRDCANLWPDVGLIPERPLQLSLRKGHLPQGLVSEYNFTATKEAPRTESSGGKTAPPFSPGGVAKVAALRSADPSTGPQAPGWVQAQLCQASSHPGQDAGLVSGAGHPGSGLLSAVISLTLSLCCVQLRAGGCFKLSRCGHERPGHNTRRARRPE